MKIAVIGYGRQGKSAAEYWHKLNHNVTICDQNTSVIAPKWAKKQLGAKYLNNLKSFDLIVRSPMVHPSTLAKAGGNDILKKVTTTTNEFMQVCPSKNIIGVTGTKGKGTTSTLITKMLEASGKTVHLGGNIGIDPLQLLKNNIKKDDWVVLELANFQLIDLKHSPHIAVCLTFAKEHTDWHKDITEYKDAKKELFKHQKTNDIAIYYANNQHSKEIAIVSKGIKIPYLEPPGAYVKDEQIIIDNTVICNIKDIKLLGTHSWQNICAATTAIWQITKDADALQKTISNFEPLPHRIQLVRTKNSIKYYNDSFSTGQASTIAAIKAISGQKVLILGGYDRYINLEPLYETILEHKNDLRHLLLLGQSAQRLADELKEHGYTNFTLTSANTMPQIIKEATDIAQPNDSIVLSPAFASFGMFKDFEDRGEQFIKYVTEL